MATPPCHIVFTPYADKLRQAIKEAGRPDEVACLYDRFDLGPINPSGLALRSKWIEDTIGPLWWDEVPAEASLFWERALSRGTEKIVWVSRRNATEYSGFLEWLSRSGASPCKVVDVTDVALASESISSRRPDVAISLAHIPAWRIRELGLLDRSEELTPAMRDQYRRLWERLRDENAPIRILSDGALSSVSIAHFDEVLMAQATTRWRKVAMVVGKASDALNEPGLGRTDDLVLAARVRALCNQGRLHGVGDLFQIRFSEVRLPIENADEEPESCEIPESTWPMTPSDKPPQV